MLGRTFSSLHYMDRFSCLGIFPNLIVDIHTHIPHQNHHHCVLYKCISQFYMGKEGREGLPFLLSLDLYLPIILKPLPSTNSQPGPCLLKGHLTFVGGGLIFSESTLLGRSFQMHFFALHLPTHSNSQTAKFS